MAEALGEETKMVTLAIGLDDAVVRQVELPQIPVDEMRMVLKNNSKTYMQQDLPEYVFDCYIFPPRQAAPGRGEPLKSAAAYPS